MHLKYNSKKQTLIGPFMLCNEPERSGNIYPKSEVEKAIAQYQHWIDNGSAVGELVSIGDHPTYLYTDPSRAAVRTTKVYFKKDGSVLYGEFAILNTPFGEILKTLLDNGIRFKAAMGGTTHAVNNRFTKLQIMNFSVAQYYI